MWEFILKKGAEIFGAETKDGSNQFLELLKGQKQKEREFQLAVDQEQNRLQEIAIKDVQNARSMQVAALQQNDIFSKRFVPYLTAGIIGMAALLGLIPLFIAIPEANKEMISEAQNFWYMIAGGSCIGYFYGTNTTKK